MDRAEQVRRVLGTRGLTLYRVSQLSAQAFGRTSRFYVPHNLYSDVADSSLIPTLHQILALSHMTNYRLSDWLAVFRIDLDLIPRLRLLAPRQGTTLLDSSVYDPHAWIPWFAERSKAVPVPPIAPLGQFLTSAGPRRARGLLALNKAGFLYGKVGEGDLHAFPHLVPGSIVRVDPRRSHLLVTDSKTDPQGRLFLVEHPSGYTCSQLVVLARDRVMLHSPQCPCAQIELRLGKEARILGMVDAEIRPTTHPHNGGVPRGLPPAAKVRPLHAPSEHSTLQDLLLGSRLRAGLSFREASTLSRWIANMLSDEQYFAAASTLSDYETLSAPPRHVQKAISLCVLYGIDFWQFLRSSGMPLDQAGGEPIPDELVARPAPDRNHSVLVSAEDETLAEPTGLLGSLLEQWQEVPLFLRHALNELTGLKNFSLSDVFWVGGDETPHHPSLTHATLVAVNRRVKKPAPSTAMAFCQQPLYLLLKRDGSYLCGPCSLEDGNLVVPAYPGGAHGTRHFKKGMDAEIIGQVTAILRRLD